MSDQKVGAGYTLALEFVAPSILKDDPRNPRSHTPPQIAAIARSIKTFGFNVPILADGDDRIIAGHGRTAAALKLGLEAVPVVRLAHLTSEQRQAFAIADNRLTDTSKWDEQLLGEVLRDLSVAELDFELDAIGFSVAEIDMKIEALIIGGEEEEEEIIPGLFDGPAVTAPKDLFEMAAGRVGCLNSLERESWGLLMNGKKARMAFTDPPYGLPASFFSGLGKIKHRDFIMGAGEMDRDEFTAFLAGAFRQMADHMEAGALAYVFMDHRHLVEMMSAGESSFADFKTMCVWVKPSGAMGGLYRNQMELIFVWKAVRGRSLDNVALGKHGRNRTTVWQYPSISGFRYSEGGDLLKIHPTSKPVRLVADAILDVTARGDIVIDPFMGSGATLIAAQRVGRIAYGMEIDPLYCDAILRRYRALTGDEPVHLASGKTFAELEAERCKAAE